MFSFLIKRKPLRKKSCWETQMAYDEDLAQRVRLLLKRRKGFSERKMFGGICFMLHGNMCCGVTRERLMLRLGEQGAHKA
ncbi:MAG: TfoX/Sxy family protein, partial [Planctomycetaceae bacterium]|nr:TfoX/Sxy family protein [Planctomycetaceae bacterium]